MPVIVCETCDYWMADGNNSGFCTHIGDYQKSTTRAYIEHNNREEVFRLMTHKTFGCNDHSALEKYDEEDV